MYLALCLCCSLCLLAPCLSKSITGTVSTQQAWEEHGQFVTKFCFHDKKALFNYTINTSSTGKFYFFLDETWPYAMSEDDCSRKLAMAKFDVSLSVVSGSQFINQWVRPHFWFLVYADPNTCQQAPPPSNKVVEYEMVFLNPDSNGDATDHFGDDDRGMLTFYTLLILIYCAGLSLYTHRVWVAISKGGPMHEILKMLSVVMAMHFLAALLMWVHLWRYSINGRGITLFEILSELLEMLAQCQMVWMLLSMSLGWTLGSSTGHPIRDKKQLATITTVACLHVILVLWEQLYDEAHYTYHVHESLPGYLLLLLRLCLAGLFAVNLRATLTSERSALRRDFYQSFSIGCYLWFLAFPVLMLLTLVFAPYVRQKVVTVGVTIIQTVAMVLLSRLFLSRSLYWEVSTLSSSTLPLRGKRGGVAGFLTRLS